MRIFEVPDGQRVPITTGSVNVSLEDMKSSGMIQSDVSYEATATDRYMTDYKGIRRRCFLPTRQSSSTARMKFGSRIATSQRSKMLRWNGSCQTWSENGTKLAFGANRALNTFEIKLLMAEL